MAGQDKLKRLKDLHRPLKATVVCARCMHGVNIWHDKIGMTCCCCKLIIIHVHLIPSRMTTLVKPHSQARADK